MPEHQRKLILVANNSLLAESKQEMPLDHFVSQTHLRKFYAPALGERMHALRKSDMNYFTPNSESVCRILDGNTNPYLRDSRAIEEFLKTIEPHYNEAVERLTSGNLNDSSIYVISGFIAYVMSCSPAGMRIFSAPLRGMLEITADLLDQRGEIPAPPPQLGGKGLTELLQKGIVKINIDPKYPQAMGIEAILKHTAIFGNFRWDILINDFGDNPFFTSDYPVAIEDSELRGVVNRIIPLTPYLAIRILPDPRIDLRTLDFSFSNFAARRRHISRPELLRINKHIVRCAEDLVFYSCDAPWIQPFVDRNRQFWIEPVTRKLPTPKGKLLITTQTIAKKR